MVLLLRFQVRLAHSALYRDKAFAWRSYACTSSAHCCGASTACILKRKPGQAGYEIEAATRGLVWCYTKRRGRETAKFSGLRRLEDIVCRVEMWRGGVGPAYPFPALSSAGASPSKPCSVSTSRSSNRTCAFNCGRADRHTVPAPDLDEKDRSTLSSTRMGRQRTGRRPVKRDLADKGPAGDQLP